MIAEYYFYAWCLYLGAIPIILWPVWHFSNMFPGWVRQGIRVFVAVILLTPMPVSQAGELWIAPAAAVLFVETVVQGFGVGRRALPFLFYALLGVSALLLLWTLFRNRARKEDGPMSNALRKGSGYSYGMGKKRIRRVQRGSR